MELRASRNPNRIWCDTLILCGANTILPIMIAFDKNSEHTRLEDSPVTKHLTAGCPTRHSNQGGYVLTHYGSCLAPWTHLMGALLTIGVHMALLIFVFIPVAKVQSIFIPWLVGGGLLGA